VPFAVAGGNAIGTGRGETLTPVASRGAFEWVLVTSSAGLSTPQVFAHFDALEPGAVPGLATASGPGPAVRPGAGGPPPIPAALLAGLTAGDPAAVGANLVNDLQPAALSLRPELADVIGAALDAGALGAIVSGSGPTIACLAAAPESAHALATALHSRLTTLNPAPTILRATGPAPPAQFRQSVSFSCQVDRDPPYASKTS
jgi:4-diphosphocytidyl-2-C-methyl-D-erythritol kinase